MMKHIAGTAALGTGPRHPRPGLEPAGLHISGGVQAVRSQAASSNTTQQPEQPLPAGQMPREGPQQAGAGEPDGSGDLEEQGCELEVVAGRGGAQEEAGTAVAEMSRRDGLQFP